MTQLSRLAANVIPLRPRADPVARRPEHLDLVRMRARHGWGLGTLLVWRARIAARGDLQRLALWAPDSVLEDAGICREAAAREARRWVWQELLPQQDGHRP